jgi:hypothetical protein
MSISMSMFGLSFSWNRVSHWTLSELVAVVGDKIPPPPPNPSFLDRIFNQERTFWLFLNQVLSATQSCRVALKQAQMWLSLSSVSALSGKKKHLF